jgi:predicted transposase/invertase (TIGR01784 family)
MGRPASGNNVEEVIRMDMAIQEAEAKMRVVTQDKESMRLYEIRENAMHDWASSENQARREGRQEGKIEDARNMLRKGLSSDLIYEITGIDTKTIQSL